MAVEIVDKVILVLVIAIIARSLLSFFLDPRHPVAEFLYTVTEPMLRPLRSVMPRTGMLDLTPLVAILLLQLVVRRILLAALDA